MCYLGDASIEKIVVHEIGNKLRKDGVNLSNKTLEVDEKTKMLLTSYFMKNQKKIDHKFSNINDDSNTNEIYNCAVDLFGDKESIFDISINVGRHLYNCSTHPKVQGGTLFVVYFSGAILEEKEVDVIGVFKSETIDTLLDIKESDNVFNIDSLTGFNISKVDNGCLIFNTSKEDGYKVMLINNKSGSKYWTDQFLCIEKVYDNSDYTKALLKTCDDFVKKVLPEKIEDEDQITGVKAKIVEYLSDSENMNTEKFISIVSEDFELGEELNNLYVKNMSKLGSNSHIIDFPIEKEVIQKSIKKFDKIIKLDTGIEIKINSEYLSEESDIIEKCYENGQSFYKVLYNEEI